MKRLENFKIFVTGGSRGIGAGIALKLAQEGAQVALSYTSKPDLAQKVVSELPGSGHFSLKMDISDETSVQTGFKEIFEKFGNLDGLVNNAGITKDQLLLRMKTEDFDQVIQTNLRGVFLCTKEATRPMLKARKGSIVNITSVIGQMGQAGQANYAASKAGIEAFSKSVALELASRNIRSNCVAPGFIETDMTAAMNETQKEAITQAVPLQSIGQAEDVAAAVCFLLSDESRYVTGQTISVNGGLFMP
ncbi:MAG: 3-oxoacyl-[acyl-carrier-protein] reductase [Bdellovibrionales bacterium]